MNTSNVQSSQGIMKIQPQKYNFGSVNKNIHEKVKHDIVLNNIGDKMITIKNVDVSCGCISAKVESNTILPGSSIKLTFEINTSNQLGYFNKVIYVDSDAKNSLELIRVKGEIVE